MKVKDLIKKLKEMPENLSVVVWNKNDDGDGDGYLYLPEVQDVEISQDIIKEGGLNEDVVFIVFER
jgi:ribosome biogenesis protein Nip4